MQINCKNSIPKYIINNHNKKTEELKTQIFYNELLSPIV